MTSDKSKRIAKNTLALYVQMLLAMAIGLYTSRVVLNVLGVADFGIYNLVGGVVTLFGMLNSAMSSSTSRFITFELGRENRNRLRLVFSTSLLIHILLALLLCLLAESIGLWFLNTQLNIPAARMDAAIWVFHLSIAGAFISIINVPYNAVIIAHEKMKVYAYFAIIDVLLKLAIVFALQGIAYDKLKIYALLLLAAQVLMQLLYWIYCYRTFEEVRVGLRWNKSLFKKMTSFAGWSLFGDAALLLFTQGLNILLNIFFGATVNAARGIAVQVQGLIIRFIGGFQTALNPQVTKSFAAKDLKYMHKLIYASSKYSFFLVLLLSMPVFLDTEHLLTWWLKIVPPHTVNFVRIMILISLIDCLANPLIISAKATGKIKLYQSVVGSLLLLVVPFAYVALKFGYPPESVFIVHLSIAVLSQLVRVLLIRKMIDLSVSEYFRQVVFKCVIVLLLSPLLPYFTYQTMTDPLTRFLGICLASIFSMGLLVYFMVMEKGERLLVNGFLLRVKDTLYEKG